MKKPSLGLTAFLAACSAQPSGLHQSNSEPVRTPAALSYNFAYGCEALSAIAIKIDKPGESRESLQMFFDRQESLRAVHQFYAIAKAVQEATVIERADPSETAPTLDQCKARFAELGRT